GARDGFVLAFITTLNDQERPAAVRPERRFGAAGALAQLTRRHFAGPPAPLYFPVNCKNLQDPGLTRRRTQAALYRAALIGPRRPVAPDRGSPFRPPRAAVRTRRT